MPPAEIDWSTSWGDAALRLLIAALCAGIIGWERETVERPAGLRTHMMVALGAAAFALVACEVQESLDGSTMNGDPIRLLSAIIGGIGFLAAGAIIQAGDKVRGLTTAAGLWVIAAIGMTCGLGLFAQAGMLTILSLLVLTVLRYVETKAMGTKKEAGS